MVTFIQTALKPITFLLALFHQAPPPVAAKPVATDPIAREPVAAVPSKTVANPVAAEELPRTMAAFINRLGRDPAFRARFADAPETLLRAAGIDPAPYDLAPKMRESDVQRLVAQWTKPWVDLPPWMDRTIPPPLTHRQFMAKVRADAALRARFMESPADTMLGLGLDPIPFQLPESLNDADLEEMFSAWEAQLADQDRIRHDIERQRAEQMAQVDCMPMPPAPVYGPPASPPKIPRPVEVPHDKPDRDLKRAPPVAVYGPSPGPFRK